MKYFLKFICKFLVINVFSDINHVETVLFLSWFCILLYLMEPILNWNLICLMSMMGVFGQPVCIISSVFFYPWIRCKSLKQNTISSGISENYTIIFIFFFLLLLGSFFLLTLGHTYPAPTSTPTNIYLPRIQTVSIHTPIVTHPNTPCQSCLTALPRRIFTKHKVVPVHCDISKFISPPSTPPHGPGPFQHKHLQLITPYPTYRQTPTHIP